MSVTKHSLCFRSLPELRYRLKHTFFFQPPPFGPVLLGSTTCVDSCCDAQRPTSSGIFQRRYVHGPDQIHKFLANQSLQRLHHQKKKKKHSVSVATAKKHQGAKDQRANLILKAKFNPLCQCDPGPCDSWFAVHIKYYSGETIMHSHYGRRSKKARVR